MSNEQITITIAGLSLLVSLLSAVWAFIAQRKASKLSEGNLELVLAERISKTRETELEVSIRIAEIAKDQKKKTDALKKHMSQREKIILMHLMKHVVFTWIVRLIKADLRKDTTGTFNELLKTKSIKANLMQTHLIIRLS